MILGKETSAREVPSVTKSAHRRNPPEKTRYGSRIACESHRRKLRRAGRPSSGHSDVTPIQQQIRPTINKRVRMCSKRIRFFSRANNSLILNSVTHAHRAHIRGAFMRYRIFQILFPFIQTRLHLARDKINILPTPPFLR